MNAPCGQEDCGHTIEKLVAALKNCERFAIARIKNADAAVKKDIYAVDALMGIVTTARRAAIEEEE